MKPREVFLRALHRETVPRTATGSATSVVTVNLMRELGIFFPEAHLDAEKMARLAAAGHTVLGFDNVMPLFSVCHDAAALGCEINWGQIDVMPTCGKAPYAIDDEIIVPEDFLKRPAARVALDAIELLDKWYGDDVAIVGKVFGPWTLGYHMFGVEEFLINSLLKPDAIKQAMATLKEATILFGEAQMEAGADALCTADHATRETCSPNAYREFLFEIHQEIVERLPCPLILHICGDTSDRIPDVAKTGIACFHFDSKVPSATARVLAGDRLSLMGGTSNLGIIQHGSPEEIEREVWAKVADHVDIIGPECAVPLNAPYENLKVLAAEAKRHTFPAPGLSDP